MVKLRETLTIPEKLAQPDPEWRVEGLIMEGTDVLVYGQQGTGKSFLTLDLGLHIALGCDWHGHKVKRGRVYLWAGEGQLGSKKRYEAWFRWHGLAPETDGHFLLDERPFHLINSEHRQQMLNTLLDWLPDVLVLGPMFRTYPGADETNALVNTVYSTLGEWRAALGGRLTVIMDHHVALASERPRGGTTWDGGADHMYFMEGNPSEGVGLLRDHKQKDEKRGTGLELSYEKVWLTEPDDPEPKSSLVIAAVQTLEAKQAPSAGKPRATDLQVYQWLESVKATEGKLPGQVACWDMAKREFGLGAVKQDTVRELQRRMKNSLPTRFLDHRLIIDHDEVKAINGKE